MKVLNLTVAKYRCLYPECGGECCNNGRPGLISAEISLIRQNLEKFIPLSRSCAQRFLTTHDFITSRKKEGAYTLAVIEEWCIFANQGCVLQKVGMAEGDKWKYKPHRCVLFPITSDAHEEEWYIRQKGYHGETWNIACLERTLTETALASESLKDELAYLDRYCKRKGDKSG